MSWHCSRALVAEYLAANYSDGERYVQSSTTPTPEAYYWPDKTTEHSRLSRFGMTSEPLTERLGAAVLTSYLAAFPVKTLVRPAVGLDLAEAKVAYGMRWLGSFAKYSRDSSTWKTAQNSLAEGLDEFLETWPKWGLMLNGVSSELVTLARRMSAKEYGFVPTPTASNTKAHHMRGADKGKAREPRSYGEHGPLNPEYLEWLMGWPVGWTELKPLGMGRFREWLQQHGTCSSLESRISSKS